MDCRGRAPLGSDLFRYCSALASKPVVPRSPSGVDHVFQVWREGPRAGGWCERRVTNKNPYLQNFSAALPLTVRVDGLGKL